jgi:hypothetical protein
MEFESQELYTRADFDTAMYKATSLHIAREYNDVLALRLDAHKNFVGSELNSSDESSAEDILRSGEGRNLTEEDLITVAGNVRNIAATYERLGDDESASAAIECALKLHETLLRRSSESNRVLNQRLCREIAADEFYLGALAAKDGLTIELEQGRQAAEVQGEIALEYMRDSASSFEDARSFDNPDDPPHQYEINGSPRGAVVEAVWGDRKRARELGRMALWGALRSEANRPAKERWRAVTKATMRAMGAIAVTELAAIGDRKLPGISPAARKAAVRMTQKLL